ncbi:hypothetical protein AX774_g4362 [Zancudomyces culisetae]|uniref:Uncharacterized protein n=1 Tax=Zancudomyces culisetae TaxID=1213189 RepID=A0A1R1PCE6_ZANCU|nr:hypothetical protein AX774_g7999 [Zancudomyces culisetae]OMH82083.1 hypothetical protein AX774_g4442 [Zancudomyces culisetae]OMH82165.1 hypothetical protein AX774_g4362 [Zancudomyces culisetae]|eukprot:OMH78611.1 hypothetical protein AX774_g7999 [Zancudomyces culisetae]
MSPQQRHRTFLRVASLELRIKGRVCEIAPEYANDQISKSLLGKHIYTYHNAQTSKNTGGNNEYWPFKEHSC